MRFAPAILLTLLMAGCASPMATTATNTAVCEVWMPISWSSKDTDQTIREIKVNNARRDGWCDKRK